MTETEHKGTFTLDMRIKRVEDIVGHTFKDKSLIQVALTHPSAIEDGSIEGSYERLEFLGDSVVGLCVAEEIFERFPMFDEGGLTRIKVSVVSGTTLSSVARSLGLDEVIIFGPSEKGTGGRGMVSALENVYEAITAALLLDGGLEVAQKWVMRTLGPLLSKDAAEKPENPKSSLQEALQARGELPHYRIALEEGPPHARIFTSEVVVGGVVLGTGTGMSKKEAESIAAKEAIEKLD